MICSPCMKKDPLTVIEKAWRRQSHGGEGDLRPASHVHRVDGAEERGQRRPRQLLPQTATPARGSQQPVDAVRTAAAGSFRLRTFHVQSQVRMAGIQRRILLHSVTVHWEPRRTSLVKSSFVFRVWVHIFNVHVFSVRLDVSVVLFSVCCGCCGMLWVHRCTVLSQAVSLTGRLGWHYGIHTEW